MSIHMEFFESCQSIITNILQVGTCVPVLYIFLVKLESDHKELILAFIHAS